MPLSHYQLQVEVLELVAYIFGNSLASLLPLEASWFSCDSLKGLESFKIKVALAWSFSRPIAEEAVGERVCCSVHSQVCEGSSEKMSVG